MSLHLNPLSSQISTFPSTRMNNPLNLSLLNFISLNLKVYFFRRVNILHLVRCLFRYQSFLLTFLALTKRGSTICFPRQNPRPYLLSSWLRYEQSLKRISPLLYYLSSMCSQRRNKVESGSPLKRATFLRKLYLQSSSKVICPCQNSLNSALDILMI